MTSNLHVDLPSESTCIDFAFRIAEHIVPGDVLALNGELGAGKTTFVKGLVQALKGDVTSVQSPTYTLMHIYEARLTVVHIDAYRLDNNAALEALGYAEYADDGILCLEWADRLEPVTSSKHLWTLNFKHKEGGTRSVEVSVPGNRNAESVTA